jgi:PPK2 family polyphosphate:nucleotide phosphotransferase
MDDTIRGYRVPRDKGVDWSEYPPDDRGEFAALPDGRTQAEEQDTALRTRIGELQERLYAESKQALLIILQGMDAGGKDGTIKHVMSHVNPQGCAITSFKAPTHQEQAHDFLWRIHNALPPRGFIGIFNRSHYEDVLVTRVHGELDDETARLRFRQINDFERALSENGVTILKFFLHISPAEQKRRLEARLRDPEKNWKFNAQDLAERKFWRDYQKMYAQAIEHTNTRWARWWIIPGDAKWYRNFVVATVIAHALKKMDPQFPPPPPGVDLEHIVID